MIELFSKSQDGSTKYILYRTFGAKRFKKSLKCTIIDIFRSESYSPSLFDIDNKRLRVGFVAPDFQKKHQITPTADLNSLEMFPWKLFLEFSHGN